MEKCKCYVEWEDTSAEGHNIVRCATHDAAVEMEGLMRRMTAPHSPFLPGEWVRDASAILAPIDKENATLARAAKESVDD